MTRLLDRLAAHIVDVIEGVGIALIGLGAPAIKIVLALVLPPLALIAFGVLAGTHAQEVQATPTYLCEATPGVYVCIVPTEWAVFVPLAMKGE